VAASVNSFFEERVLQLFDLANLVEQVFASAGLEYRVIGGLATYLYVEDVEPDADIAVRREDLEKIAKAAEPFGLEYRNVEGVGMLVRKAEPSIRRAVHLVFTGEKVRPEYSQPAPDLGPYRTIKGTRLIPLADLIRMKLTSFRLRDQTHLQDMDEAGLITPEVDVGLPPLLRERLAQVRASD
jgi:hypothetical protein